MDLLELVLCTSLGASSKESVIDEMFLQLCYLYEKSSKKV